MSEILGLHHVTSVGADAGRTLDFYTRTLGLRLLKRTVNFDEPSVLHFYCGAKSGTPGALLTFLIHEDAPQGRRGNGKVSSIVLAVPPGALPDWRRRLTERGVGIVGSAWSFGDEHLCFTDPDGLELALMEDPDCAEVACDPPSSAAPDRAIRRIRSVEIQTDGFQHTARLLLDMFGFRPAGQEGPIVRFQDGPFDHPVSVDLLCTPNHRPGNSGPGVAHHIAWRVANVDALMRVATALADLGFDVTPPLDRRYFHAIYFRAPCGVRFAIATDGPGFAEKEDGSHVSRPRLASGLRSWRSPVEHDL